MNDRIRQLREQSVNAVPTLSLERARLLTEFCHSGTPERVSAPVGRALAFKHILEHKEICINPGELIVGERGPAPKATPTYPEICTHTLKDFDILNSREKIPFEVSDETRRMQRDLIIPFWAGRSMRDRIFAAMDADWVAAYEAGIFTEFQEQRAPGHTVLDDKIYRAGFLDFRRAIERRIGELDFFGDPDAYGRWRNSRRWRSPPMRFWLLRRATRSCCRCWPIVRPTLSGKQNGNRWCGFVGGFRLTRPGRSGRRFSTTGSCISV